MDVLSILHQLQKDLRVRESDRAWGSDIVREALQIFNTCFIEQYILWYLEQIFPSYFSSSHGMGCYIVAVSATMHEHRILLAYKLGVLLKLLLINLKVADAFRSFGHHLSKPCGCLIIGLFRLLHMQSLSWILPRLAEPLACSSLRQKCMIRTDRMLLLRHYNWKIPCDC